VCIARDVHASTLRHEHFAHVNATETVIFTTFDPNRGHLLTYLLTLRHTSIKIFLLTESCCALLRWNEFLSGILLYVSNNAFYGIPGFSFLDFDSHYAAINNVYYVTLKYPTLPVQSTMWTVKFTLSTQTHATLHQYEPPVLHQFVSFVGFFCSWLSTTNLPLTSTDKLA